MIRGVHADIDLRAIGLNLETLAFIKLAKYERAVIDRLLRRVEAIPEVRRVFLVRRRHDVIVHVVVKDIDHLGNLGCDHFTNQPEVVNIDTSTLFDSRSRNELPILKKGVEPTKASARPKKTPRR